MRIFRYLLIFVLPVFMSGCGSGSGSTFGKVKNQPPPPSPDPTDNTNTNQYPSPEPTELNYGDEDDTIRPNKDGAYIINSGAGNDLIWGGDGVDTIYGGDGVDTIYGGAGNDTIYGGAGHDRISSGTGDDTIYGGDGIDNAEGNTGNDIIEGGAGNDIIKGGTGTNNIESGTGKDTFVYDNSSIGGKDRIHDFVDDVLDFSNCLINFDINRLDDFIKLDEYPQFIPKVTAFSIYINGDGNVAGNVADFKIYLFTSRTVQFDLGDMYQTGQILLP